MELILEAVNLFFNVLYGLLFAYCIMSWIPSLRRSGLGQMLERLVAPMLNPVRNLVRKSPLGGPGMMIDISVLIVFALLSVVRTVVISLLVILA